MSQENSVYLDSKHDALADWQNELGFDTVREDPEPIELHVKGRIPVWAAGTLYRNGPGANRVENEVGETAWQASHWFDAFGQLHRFEITPDASKPSGVRVHYNSRINVDSLMQSLAKTGHFNGYTFAQKRDPCMSLFRKVKCLFTPTPGLAPTSTNAAITVTANSSGTTKALDQERGHETGASTLVARTDEAVVKTLDARTLEPIGIAHQSQLHPLLTGPLSASHAKSDQVTGDVFNFNLDFGYKSTYRVFRTAAATGKTDILASISSHEVQPAYLHSFFLTENFVILCIWNSHIAGYGLKVLWEKNILDALSPFDAQKPVKWLVVDRRHGRGLVAAFDSPAMYCFHSVNAWEEPTSATDAKEDQSHEAAKTNVNIYCDLIQYPNLDVLHRFYYVNLRSSSQEARNMQRDCWEAHTPHFVRYKLSSVPLAADAAPCAFPDCADARQDRPPSEAELAALAHPGKAEVTKTISNYDSGDIPTINPAYATKPYRYFYCCIGRGRSTFLEEIAKVDTVTGTSVVWEHEYGHTPGETVFVARPREERGGGQRDERSDEDDGVLLSVVLDGNRGRSYLVCIDAVTMKELGRAELDNPIAFGFHGQFVTADGGMVIDA
ncbi:MAG: hypothetical protein M1828_000298 [Chrysothrix sp. TS-e1954]|nr:MAG: hypothetical protein M1828_000298 [Chrysothrix sp. TS-e1954]